MGAGLHHEFTVASSAIGYRDGRAFYLDASRVPAGRVRTALERRLRSIEESLAFRNHGEVAKAVSSLLAMFSREKPTPDQARERIALYCRALDDLPAWAVVKACDGWARGEGGQAAFMPTSAELHQRAEALCAPLQRERTRLFDVLNAQPPPSEAQSTSEQRRAQIDRAQRLFAEADVDALEREARESRARDDMLAANEAFRRRELEAAGIDPDSTPHSLAMLEKLGKVDELRRRTTDAEDREDSR